MRLSSTTSSYLDRGTVIDRLQITAIGGETEFSVTFTKDNEEVYVNGIRLYRGPSKDYVTEDSKVILNTPLVAGDQLLLIGRNSAGSISFSAARTERVVLSDGQRVVTLSQVTTEGTVYYVSGASADNSILSAPRDYMVTGDSTLELTTSYPGGTVLEAFQGQRAAWPDPNTLLIDDGLKVESLSSRFSKIKESYQYFIETEGRQLQELKIGQIIQKWIITNGVPVTHTSGVYPAILLDRAIWMLEDGLTGNYVIQNWVVSTNTITLTTDRGFIYAYRRIGGADATPISIPDATDQDIIDELALPRILMPSQLYDAMDHRTMVEQEVADKETEGRLIPPAMLFNYSKAKNDNAFFGRSSDIGASDPLDSSTHFNKDTVGTPNVLQVEEGVAAAVYTAKLPYSTIVDVVHTGAATVYLVGDSVVPIVFTDVLTVDGVEYPLVSSVRLDVVDDLLISFDDQEISFAGTNWQLHAKLDVTAPSSITLNTPEQDLVIYPYRPVSHLGDAMVGEWDTFTSAGESEFSLRKGATAVDVYVNWVIQTQYDLVKSDGKITGITISTDANDVVAVRRYREAPVTQVVQSGVEVTQLYEMSGYATAGALDITLSALADEVRVLVDGVEQSSSGYVAVRNTSHQITSVSLSGLSGGEWILIKFRESTGGDPLNIPIIQSI